MSEIKLLFDKRKHSFINIEKNNSMLIENSRIEGKNEIYLNNFSLVGDNKTTLTNGDHYNKIMDDNIECNTFRTYTLKIVGNNVTIKNITIENTCINSKKYGQSVSLHIIGNNCKVINCNISSGQDTIFLAPYPENLRERYKYFLPDQELNITNSNQYFENCIISGDVDFIFGGGKALFYNCIIKSIGKGYICAPSHSKEQKYGFLFYNCKFECKTNNDVYLARPWRDYGCAAFINCTYDNGINEKGFNHWDGTERYKTCRFYEYTENIKYNRNDYVKILSKNEAISYIKDYLKDFFVNPINK